MNKFAPIILILLAGAGGFLYLKPQYEKIQAHRVESANYDNLIEQAKELRTLQGTLEAKRDSISPEDIERLSKLIPEKIDTARLILDIGGVASKYAISLDGFQTAEIIPDSRPGEEKLPYTATTLSFDFQTSYEAMLAFVKDLERSLRMVDVVEVSLTSDDAAAPFLDYTITLKAYWLNTQETENTQ